MARTLIGNIKGPKGDTGDTGATGATGAAGASASVSVGTVTALEYGNNPTVTNSGSAQNAVFNFGIPKGKPADNITELDNLPVNSSVTLSADFPVPAVGDTSKTILGKIIKWFGDMSALVATKFNTANVVNNLTTTASGYALDARQGKALNDSLANYLTVRTVQTTIPQAHGSRASVTAPTVQGYTFVTWYVAISKGWIGNVYFETPIAATSNIWSANYGYGASGNGEVVAYALYKKNV